MAVLAPQAIGDAPPGPQHAGGHPEDVPAGAVQLADAPEARREGDLRDSEVGVVEQTAGVLAGLVHEGHDLLGGLLGHQIESAIGVAHPRAPGCDGRLGAVARLEGDREAHVQRAREHGDHGHCQDHFQQGEAAILRRRAIAHGNTPDPKGSPST